MRDTSDVTISGATHADDWLAVAPDAPDAPGVPFPRVKDDAFDPILAEVSAFTAGRRATALATTTAARLVAIAAALGLMFALRNDVRYALSSSSPVMLSAKSGAAEIEGAANRYVSFEGVAGGVGAVEYRRPLREGLFRLAPIVDRPEVFVELRLHDDDDPVRFVPPTSVAGRLVLLDEGGARFRDARALIERATGTKVAARAFLIEPGSAPSLTLPGALVALLAMAIGALQGGSFLQSLADDRRRRARLAQGRRKKTASSQRSAVDFAND